jgi:hypothetical protein
MADLSAGDTSASAATATTASSIPEATSEAAR